MKNLHAVFASVGIALLAFSVSACGSLSRPSAPQPDGTLQALITQVSAQSTQIAEHETYISHLATRIPAPQLQPGSPPIPTPFVTGSLLIEEGKCCVGAIAGQSVRIRVAFQATSPVAPVIEMRVRAGPALFGEPDFSDEEWGPFLSEKHFEYIAPINWTGFYVSAHYKDALGNLSPVYSSDISVEGMPPATP